MQREKFSKEKKIQVVVISTQPNFENSYLLLLKLNKQRGGGWQNITGHVDKGESFLKGAKREFQEETQIDLKKEKINLIDLNYTFEFKGRLKGQYFKEKIFLALHIRKESKSLPSVVSDVKEHSGFRWFKIESVTLRNFKHSSNFICFVKGFTFLWECFESRSFLSKIK